MLKQYKQVLNYQKHNDKTIELSQYRITNKYNEWITLITDNSLSSPVGTVW